MNNGLLVRTIMIYQENDYKSDRTEAWYDNSLAMTDYLFDNVCSTAYFQVVYCCAIA